MEHRSIKRLNRPLNKLGWKFGVIWLITIAITAMMTHWIGAWAMILLALGFLVIFVVEGRLGSRYFIWTVLTTHCPECGMWPMKYKGSPSRDDNHGFLICEKCQIEWDLGRNTGVANLDLTSVFENNYEIIDKHIQNNDPPETRQTMERLTKEGCTLNEARQLISVAVVVEVFHVFCDRKPFDPKRYAWNLARLPQKPWDAQGKEIYKPAK